MNDLESDWLDGFRGHQVVADLDGGLTVFGHLDRIGHTWLELSEADVHHQYEANSSREVYAMECKHIGIRANRRRVSIPRPRLLAISRLEDVVE